MMPALKNLSNGELAPTSRQSIPIEQHLSGKISNASRKRLNDHAKKMLENDPTLSATTHFGPQVGCGLQARGPALIFADQSEISLFGAPEDMLLEYRMAILCQPGDMLVISHDRSEAFEAYLRDYLDIRDFDVLVAGGQSHGRQWSLPKRCLKSDKLFKQIAHKTSQNGLLTIIPYIATGHVWNLARRIAEATHVSVTLAAPPPRLAKRINDKTWFSYRVKEVLGQTALSPAYTVYGPAALAGYVKRLASKTDRLVIKIPDSAGSAGNLSLDASVFRDRSLTWIKAQLLDMLKTLGWTGTFPLKVEIWETPVLASPSAQMWIPRPQEGLPVIEGLFEQVVEGDEGKFVGAIKSQMPISMQRQMAAQAGELAFLFQSLGYFGRCSLDALVIGTDYKNAKLHWIECNGRWGGVSVPMTLTNRILENPDKFEIMIVQQSGLELPKRPFQDAIDALHDILFRRGKSVEGIILLTPTSFEQGRGVHYMAIAKTLDRARELSRLALQRLTEI